MTAEDPLLVAPYATPADPHELGALLADRETLADVTRDLMEARLALRIIRSGLSPRVRKSLAEGAYWVRLDRNAARALLDAVPD